MSLQRLLHFLGLYVLLSIPTTAAMLVYLHPYHPKSVSGWGIFFLLALPITIVAELMGEFLWTNPFAKKLDAKTVDRAVSWLRILYVLIALLLVGGAEYAIVSLFGLHA